jgi:hypothetical protein
MYSLLIFSVRVPLLQLHRQYKEAYERPVVLPIKANGNGEAKSVEEDFAEDSDGDDEFAGSPLPPPALNSKKAVSMDDMALQSLPSSSSSSSSSIPRTPSAYVVTPRLDKQRWYMRLYAFVLHHRAFFAGSVASLSVFLLPGSERLSISYVFLSCRRRPSVFTGPLSLC